MLSSGWHAKNTVGEEGGGLVKRMRSADDRKDLRMDSCKHWAVSVS